MDSKRIEKNSGQKLGLIIFECVMSVAYLALAIILLFTPLFGFSIQGGLRIVLGVLFGLYGLFRIFRVYKKIIQKDE
jgi:hypothetical protein